MKQKITEDVVYLREKIEEDFLYDAVRNGKDFHDLPPSLFLIDHAGDLFWEPFLFPLNTDPDRLQERTSKKCRELLIKHKAKMYVLVSQGLFSPPQDVVKLEVDKMTFDGTGRRLHMARAVILVGYEQESGKTTSSRFLMNSNGSIAAREIMDYVPNGIMWFNAFKILRPNKNRVLLQNGVIIEGREILEKVMRSGKGATVEYVWNDEDSHHMLMKIMGRKR